MLYLNDKDAFTYWLQRVHRLTESSCQVLFIYSCMWIKVKAK